MLSEAGGYLPVALLDDDPQRRRLRVSQVPVLGTREISPRSRSKPAQRCW